MKTLPKGAVLTSLVLALLGWQATSEAAVQCQRTLVANVVALDQPLMFNRLGAQNANGMMFALRHDVVDENHVPLSKGGAAVPGKVTLRPDKRPRPIVLRVAAGDCLTVNLTNLLAYQANPNKHGIHPEAAEGEEGEGGEEQEGIEVPETEDDERFVADEQVTDRHVGFQVNGMQAVNNISDIAANTGRNANFLVAPGGTRSYTLYAEREGAFAASSRGATFGGEGNAGNVANGLFGQVVVVPKAGRTYRNTLTEEEMRLATTGRTATGQPVIDYEARYPQLQPWIAEGKAGKPIIAMLDGNEILNSETDAIVMGPNPDGSFPRSTYPLESVGKRNPALPNRLEAFRDFASQFADEVAGTQAFPGYWADPVMGHVLEPARDSFMINYGSGGMGAEVVANRLGVGPMHDCLSCAYEEFFLSAHTVGDIGTLVDIPANVGLEHIRPGQTPPPGAIGVKASMALYPAEPRTCTTATSATSPNSATPTTATSSIFSTCTVTSGCSTPMTTTPTTSTPKASARASATPTKSPTAARATATAWRAMPSTTATSTRISPRACGPCGGCTTCSNRAPGCRSAVKAKTASMKCRSPCATANRPMAPVRCRTVKSSPVCRFRRSCRCRARPWRRCLARSRWCRNSRRRWLLNTTTTKKRRATSTPRTHPHLAPSARWPWSITAKPTGVPTAA